MYTRKYKISTSKKSLGEDRWGETTDKDHKCVLTLYLLREVLTRILKHLTQVINLEATANTTCRSWTTSVHTARHVNVVDGRHS